ncbi:alpha/beta fold hydrolase [Paucibacter sp. APW11]|uniref:Alpha/beta fold hydrolase n=1 Tax=Roseateles aquae TaxID=3077235 RepID=A0ABU3PIQ3_9BURK|nr:alpha/beta fold hydrolase [Paucibacter sp. APW11]MDT9001993.1 alpha/beta fold hydrolase [Paucibacter sp. APW11]
MEELTITCADGRPLAGRFFKGSATPSRGLLLISPATGVPQRFYTAFARHFAQRGWDVLSWDVRGIAASRQGPAAADAARLRDWGQLDLEAALQHAHQRLGYDWAQICLLGHSSGGNLSGLAPSLARLPRMALIASGTCHWRLYPKAQWPRLLLAWGLAMPLLLRLLGHVPGWAGIGQDLPPGVAREWRRWSLMPGYLFSEPGLDTAGYAAFRGELLALSVSDDRGFAPPATVRDLLHRFSAARIQHRELQPRAHGLRRIGHFGFFRQPQLWPELEVWLAAG